MLRQGIVSATILSTTIVFSALSAAARSEVVAHNVDVDSVATCSVIASKQPTWTLTDAIPTRKGARCFFVEIVKAP